MIRARIDSATLNPHFHNAQRLETAHSSHAAAASTPGIAAIAGSLLHDRQASPTKREEYIGSLVQDNAEAHV